MSILFCTFYIRYFVNSVKSSFNFYATLSITLKRIPSQHLPHMCLQKIILHPGKPHLI